MCSLFDAPNRSWTFKGLERITITLMFFRDFGLWIWLDKKDRNSGQGWTSLGPWWLIVSSSQQASQSGADVIHKPSLRKQKRKEFLGREQCAQRAMGITQGKMKRVIICFFALSVPWCFYSWEQVHGDSQRHWWGPWHLMLLVITSLCKCPWTRAYSASW